MSTTFDGGVESFRPTVIRFHSITAERYREMRDFLVSKGKPYADDYHWAETVQAPQVPHELTSQYIWVVLCSGMKATIARKIEAKIYQALNDGQAVRSVFKHPGKAAAIETAIASTGEWFSSFESKKNNRDEVIEWCQSLPWIGPVTKFHLAKNLGVDTPKPDRHIARLSNLPEYPATKIDVLYQAALDLCMPLAVAVGERLATVDLVLWWLCAGGWLWRDGGELVFAPT